MGERGTGRSGENAGARRGAFDPKDLSTRVGVMKKCAEKIEQQAPQTAENYRQQLIRADQRRGTGIHIYG